jgi:hypothetical protein
MFHISACDRNVRAVVCESKRDMFSDACAAARYEDAFSFEKVVRENVCRR